MTEVEKAARKYGPIMAEVALQKQMEGVPWSEDFERAFLDGASWQRERDAEIADFHKGINDVGEDHAYTAACFDIERAIRAQSEKVV